MLTVKLILGAGAVLATPLFAGALLAGAIGAAAPAPATAEGGLTLVPNVAGRGDTITVTNASGRTLRVAVRVRPWLQAADGTLAPDPARELLRRVRVSAPAFTLGPGERRAVLLQAASRISALYAALDVTASDETETRHRLIGGLRFPPATARHRIRARRIAGGVIEVHNLGNTAAPISGEVVAEGATSTIPRIRVLPGWRVRVHVDGARSGPASVTLRQAGRVILHRVI